MIQRPRAENILFLVQINSFYFALAFDGEMQKGLQIVIVNIKCCTSCNIFKSMNSIIELGMATFN